MYQFVCYFTTNFCHQRTMYIVSKLILVYTNHFFLPNVVIFFTHLLFISPLDLSFKLLFAVDTKTQQFKMRIRPTKDGNKSSHKMKGNASTLFGLNSFHILLDIEILKLVQTHCGILSTDFSVLFTFYWNFYLNRLDGSLHRSYYLNCTFILWLCVFRKKFLLNKFTVVSL